MASSRWLGDPILLGSGLASTSVVGPLVWHDTGADGLLHRAGGNSTKDLTRVATDGLLIILGVVLVIRVTIVVCIRYHDNLSKDIAYLITASLFVSSPFDENIQALPLDSFSGDLPLDLFEKLIIASVDMPDMRKHSELYATVQWQVRSTNQWFAMLVQALSIILVKSSV